MVPIWQVLGKKEKPCSTLVFKDPFLHGSSKTRNPGLGYPAFH